MDRGNSLGEEVVNMTTKVKCRPVRVVGKPGPKTVTVPAHKRSVPKTLPKCK